MWEMEYFKEDENTSSKKHTGCKHYKKIKIVFKNGIPKFPSRHKPLQKTNKGKKKKLFPRIPFFFFFSEHPHLYQQQRFAIKGQLHNRISLASTLEARAIKYFNKY